MNGVEPRRVMKMFELLLPGLIFVALGAGLLLGAAFAWLHTRRFVAGAVPAFGEVVGLYEHTDDGVSYSPVIRFSGPGGRAVEFTDNVASNPPGYSVGDRVKILYDPDRPRRARVATTFRLYVFATALAVVGGGFLAVGLLVTGLVLVM